MEVLESESLLDEIVQKVQSLLDMGADANDIAILSATNGDGATIEAHLKEANIEVVTETSAKLINQRSVRAIIEYIKYIYFKEDIYKANFFALLEREPFEIGGVNTKEINLLLHVKQVIERYELFMGDVNLIRFLDILAGYRDIEQFIYEHELLSEAASQRELSGVRIMTVHKSKGLEFKYVLVVDRLSKPPADRSTLIFEYDGIKLHWLYLRTKNRTFFDSDYARALERQKALAREDEINALYVAFTRAKEALFIIKKPKDSKFDLLDLDTTCYGTLQIAPLVPTLKMQQSPLTINERRYGLQKEHLTLIEGEQESQEEDMEAIRFGLALHYTLEMMHNYELNSLGSALDATYQKYGYALEDEVFEEIKRRIERLCDMDSFKAMTQGKISKEQPLSFEGGLYYLDAMIEHSSGHLVILDYKSSKSFAHKHQEQMRHYMYALSKLTNREVKGVVCYLLHEGVELKEIDV